MFCPFAGWCFVLNMRKLVHWEGAPFSQIPATDCHSCPGHAFWSCEVKVNLSLFMFLFKPGRVIGYVWHRISSQVVFSSHSSSSSLVLRSGMFVHKCMVDVQLLFKIFNSNELYPALQLVLFNEEEECSLMNWSPSSFMEVSAGLFLRWERAEQNLHPMSLLAQQCDCAWFTPGETRDGRLY